MYTARQTFIYPSACFFQEYVREQQKMSHSGTSQSLLGPGWKQVSDTEWAALANDDEYEDIEEEVSQVYEVRDP